MTTIELFILAIGVSMDAFAVAICKGLSVRKLKPSHAIVTGAYFGGFQALMPLIGYILGKQFESLVTSVDHWIGFILLGFIGVNMIKESRSCAECLNDSFSFKVMLPLAVATSIDALAVGITLAFLKVNILTSVLFIGIITFTLSAIGVKIGNKNFARTFRNYQFLKEKGLQMQTFFVCKFILRYVRFRLRR